ncbi:MAG: alpha/beta hydrolase [Cyclobacteriaceae bacterium]|nr:alpha/beta hydrolase [Cyclobacteriaceae bacterium]
MRLPAFRYKYSVVPIIGLLILLVIMDSCLQFRMSKKEISSYFKTKEKKGTLHEYKFDHQKINYLKVGDEVLPLVVFVHGSPGSLSAFIDFMADTVLLSKAQLITVDRPGFGESNFGYGEKSVARQSSVLKPLIEKNKLNRPVILVGHSMGGPVVVRMAMDYPELIDGLVIVAGSIDPDLEPNETWFRAPLATPFLKWTLPRSFRASNQEIYHLKPELQEMLPLWEKIKASTIVIQGKKDVLVDPANAQFAKKMIVNAPVELMMIDEMNHFVPWSNPELIREAIIKLISSSSTSVH